MNNDLEHIDDLLGKYLAGEATEKERVVVIEWMNAEEGNMRYFDQLRTIFDKAAQVKEIQEFNTDAAWNKVKANLKHRSIEPAVERKRNDGLWLRVAASLVILFGIGWFLFRSLSGDETTAPLEVIAEKVSVADTLPGGSDIFLNKETRLAYVYDKATSTHEVKLSGEAYFNIRKKRREDFIIDAGGVYVRDIGTSFNVRAYPDSDDVEVLVEEGEVKFFTDDNPGITLRASGKGVYNKRTKEFTIEQPEPNITAYKTKFFVFNATDLQTMADELNRVYDTQVVVPDNLKKCTITVSFRDESIEEIAAVVAETLGLGIESEGEKIVLQGEGCE